MNANKKNRMSFTEFCDRLIADGAYQSEKDGHIYRASGNILSRQCRNGYYLLRKQYGGIDMSDIMFANMEKLSSRYPDGFDVERANNRAEGDV